MTRNRSRLRVATIWLMCVASLAMVLAACGDTEEAKTGVEFGEGVLPESWPADFPVPENAVIGSTLVDHDRDRQEIQLTVPVEVAVLAQYFDINLASNGYAVDSSSGDTAEWEISFRDDGDLGTIVIQSFSGGTASAVVTIVGEG